MSEENNNSDVTKLGKIVEFLHRLGVDRHLDSSKPSSESISMHITQLAGYCNWDVDECIGERKDHGFNPEIFLKEYACEITPHTDDLNQVNKHFFNFSGDFQWDKKEAQLKPTEFPEP